ncbi:helix-turn-helix transcriptional regulator [Catenulispora yoronensis]|uniref:Helix-turn-helix transcriptional regulator n=1 Tax=Catenulispora yoronensis TaxID=450799 RepID=A0ABN2TJL3_9ACTN
MHRGNDVDPRSEIRDFLTTRRARISPDQAGLPAYGTEHRRVPGLRREEVAMLAGVSVDYYTRLERGNARGVSDQVLDALARALHLDEAETAHLFDLVRATNAAASAASARSAASAGHRPSGQRVRPGMQRLLDTMAMAPAYVRNGRMDVLASNSLGRALFAPLFDSPVRHTNIARFMFLDPAAQDFYDGWDRHAADTVALLRAEAGRNPYDKALSDLIGELSTRSEIFRVRWADHNVRFHRSGIKHLHHPVVGELMLSYESMELTADAGLRLNAYSAELGSASQDALNVLASWSATTTTAVQES